MITEQQATEIIKQKLSVNRFEHSLQVAQIARNMAENFNVDSDKAYLTGLLHDYAKGISGQELLQTAIDNNLIKEEMDKQIPDLLHAPVGAFLLRKELGIQDEQILKAVSCHTLGALDMNQLDKIIFLADMIEPGRDYPGVDRLRCLSMRNLDEGMLFGLESTIKYCIDNRRLLHPLTILVRNQFLHRADNQC
ncbi:MAG: bis(5'-nucleosyl)-tetraphosphatase (symmetrical) YqeK [Syntrophomonadaceae bacterium]|jgi:predicted HD superfamily hydrolase involved in NAD metabolism